METLPFQVRLWRSTCLFEEKGSSDSLLGGLGRRGIVKDLFPAMPTDVLLVAADETTDLHACIESKQPQICVLGWRPAITPGLEHSINQHRSQQVAHGRSLR